MTHQTDCPVCGNSTHLPFLNCKDYTVSHENFTITLCSSCNLGITNPRPENNALGKYYLSTDYISHTSKAKSLTDHLYLKARNFTLKWKRSLVASTIPDKKILDYGSGTGHFLEACQLDGWKTFGIEPSDNARALTETNTGAVIKSRLEDLDEDGFNVITLWHVLEHVPDLNDTLIALKSKLATNGTMFIAVPNHISADGKFYKQFWAGYDVPRHLWHFSRTTMKKLLAKHGLTLQTIVPMKLDSYYVSMLSEKYKREKQSVLSMLAGFYRGFRSNLAAAKTGEYSSLIYIVKK